MSRDFVREQEVKMLFLLSKLSCDMQHVNNLIQYALKKGDIFFSQANVVRSMDTVMQDFYQIRKELYPDE